MKDKEGNISKGEEQQMDRWREHFEELLNRQIPANPPTINPAAEDLPIDCSAPTKEEIRKAVGQQRNGKAAGPDSIPAEALKPEGNNGRDTVPVV